MLQIPAQFAASVCFDLLGDAIRLAKYSTKKLSTCFFADQKINDSVIIVDDFDKFCEEKEKLLTI